MAGHRQVVIAVEADGIGAGMAAVGDELAFSFLLPAIPELGRDALPQPGRKAGLDDGGTG